VKGTDASIAQAAIRNALRKVVPNVPMSTTETWGEKFAAKTAEAHPKLPGTIYSAAAEIEAAGGKALPLIVDVREEASVYEAVEKAVARFGGIDICVNNASAISLTGTLATEMKRYDLMHQVNGRGTFQIGRAHV